MKTREECFSHRDINGNEIMFCQEFVCGDRRHAARSKS